MSKELFKSRSIDEDTKILSATYISHDGLDVLWEKWFWDGIKGNSLIFLSEQVKEISDTALEETVKGIAEDISGDTTLSRKGEFTYFNFNFKTS